MALDKIQTLVEKYNVAPAGFFSNTSITIHNDNGSTGHGAIVQHIYAMPKEIVDQFMAILDGIAKQLNSK